MTIHTIDLTFLNRQQEIALYLIETSEGPILIDSGPYSTYDSLTAELAKLNYQPNDINHLFLTHIHFDHAGAAWKLAEMGTKIYLNPIGIPHLANPHRLWNSASRVFGVDEMDRLWGEMRNIEREQLIPIEDGETITIGDFSLNAWYTPGHAIHHNAYEVGDYLFTGDVLGVRMNDGPILPPCPPPDIDIEAWIGSLNKIRKINPTFLALSHFGIHDNPPSLINQLEVRLLQWSALIKEAIKSGASREETLTLFQDHCQTLLADHQVSQEDRSRIESINPLEMSLDGLMRYWDLKEKGRL